MPNEEFAPVDSFTDTGEQPKQMLPNQWEEALGSGSTDIPPAVGHGEGYNNENLDGEPQGPGTDEAVSEGASSLDNNPFWPPEQPMDKE